jgi:sugar O-acyltransferase (sialic acid O-acetyltransferase NeuD family)
MNMVKRKPIIVLGAGGHAKVLIELLRVAEYKVLGLLDINKIKGDLFCGVLVLGNDEEINNFSSGEVDLVNGIGSFPGQNACFKVAKIFRDKGYRFASVIHPASTIASDVVIEEGVQIMAACVLQPGVQVGLDSIINTGVIVDHDCIIGKNCHLAPGVTLSGGVQIHDGAHIGTGSSVIQNKIIGADTVIAAASVIYHDVPENVTYIQSRQEVITSNRS